MGACLASLLEIPLEEVPNFYEAGPSASHWHHALHTWLEARGLALIACSVKASGGDIFLNGIRGYGIASGPSPYSPDVWHATVMKDGKIVHDPMGDKAKPMESIEEVEFLRPLDPARLHTIDSGKA